MFADNKVGEWGIGLWPISTMGGSAKKRTFQSITEGHNSIDGCCGGLPQLELAWLGRAAQECGLVGIDAFGRHDGAGPSPALVNQQAGVSELDDQQPTSIPATSQQGVIEKGNTSSPAKQTSLKLHHQLIIRPGPDDAAQLHQGNPCCPRAGHGRAGNKVTAACTVTEDKAADPEALPGQIEGIAAWLSKSGMALTAMLTCAETGNNCHSTQPSYMSSPTRGSTS